MDTLSVIIIGVIVLLFFDGYFIHRIRKKRRNDFKLVIEKGIIVESKGSAPAEFLYDIQQLARIYKPENLIINGRDICSHKPKLEFLGTINPELQLKIEQSLQLSLQAI